MTEDEMVGQYLRLNGHEFEQMPGDSEEQGTWCVAIHVIPRSQTGLKNNKIPLIFSPTLHFPRSKPLRDSRKFSHHFTKHTVQLMDS